MNDEIIRTLVAQGMTDEIPQGVMRDVALPFIEGRASIVIGPRRCGKTYRLYQEAREIMRQGVNRDHILFIDFEDDRLVPCRSNTISQVVDNYEKSLIQHSESPDDETRYLFFDEVQNVPDWGRQIRRLLRSKSYRIYLSGSSAKMLSTEIASEFKGRGISCEMFPYSFTEFLRAHDYEQLAHNPNQKQVAQLQALFETYLMVGGFPEVQAADARTRIQVQQELVDTVIARDICTRHNLPMTGTEAFVKQALRTSGRELSINKMYHALKSNHVPLTRDIAYALPDYCEDAYLFFRIAQLTQSYKTTTQGIRKLYAIDPGLQYAISPASTSDLGYRFEDAVFLQLRRMMRGSRLGAIATYRTKRNREVDFVVGDSATMQAYKLIQVSAHIDTEQTAQREYAALSEALDETGLEMGEVVTLDAARCPQPDDAHIHVVSAYRWFLENAEKMTEPQMH